MYNLSEETRKNLIGKRFGMLTALGIDSVEETKSTRIYWIKCKCDCGNETIRSYATLMRNSDKQNCGCVANKKRSMFNKTGPLDPNKYLGLRLGYLTGTSDWKYVEVNNAKHTQIIKYRFICDCGNDVWLGSNMISPYLHDIEDGHKVYCSCGCKTHHYRSESAKRSHPKVTVMNSKNRSYKIWLELIYRCYKPSHKNYRSYGAKGIKICKEWYDPNDRVSSYHTFLDWLKANDFTEDAEVPMFVSRIDETKDFYPENCYLTASRDHMNKNIIKRAIEYDGQIRSFNELDDEFGGYTGMTNQYKKRGFSADKIMYIYKHPNCKVTRKGDVLDEEGFTCLIPKSGAKFHVSDRVDS